MDRRRFIRNSVLGATAVSGGLMLDCKPSTSGGGNEQIAPRSIKIAHTSYSLRRCPANNGRNLTRQDLRRSGVRDRLSEDGRSAARNAAGGRGDRRLSM